MSQISDLSDSQSTFVLEHVASQPENNSLQRKTLIHLPSSKGRGINAHQIELLLGTELK